MPTKSEQTENSSQFIPKDKVSHDVCRTVQEAQHLISYVANQGVIKMDEKALNVIIKAKYLLEGDKWSQEAEIEFWAMLDKVTAQINPVTIESLKSIIPVEVDPAAAGKKKKKTTASVAVLIYRGLAVICMILLLFAQIYWVIGSDLKQNLNSIFNEREKVYLELEQIRVLKSGLNEEFKNPQETKAESKLEILNQTLDANYELLLSWNRVWQILLFKEQFKGKVTEYVGFKHETLMKSLERELATIKASTTGDSSQQARQENEIESERLRHALDIARNRLFLTQLSADFILRALQIYLLPLLYGLLGATTFVLRTLSVEIKNLTFTTDSTIRYGLRLSLGALAGMAIGWFLKPDDINFVSSLSPLAIAFLVGYNVDIMFTMMDRFIENLTGKLKPSKIKESISKT